jgi:dipeptidyl aminopeptidase/acylaminoacyl peptidase
MSDTTDAGAPFDITGAEGEVIRGNVHLPGDDPGGKLPLLLVLHGFKGYKDYGFFPALTQRLADAGLAAVRFNFSHSGIDDDPSTFGRPDLFERDSWSNQLADVQAVLAAAGAGGLPCADRIDAARPGLLGHSRGGVTALLAGGSDRRIRAVVALSAPAGTDNLTEGQKQQIREQGFIVSPSSRTGQQLRVGRVWLEDLEQNAAKLDLLAAVRRMTAPLMIVHGTGDASVPVQCAETLAAAYPGEGELLLIDGAGHTFDCSNPFTGPSPAFNDLVAAVSAFLVEQLVDAPR